MVTLTKYAKGLRQYVANNHKGRSEAARLAIAENFLDKELPNWRKRTKPPVKRIETIKLSKADLEAQDEL